MKLILSTNGSNDFKVPHSQKSKRIRTGEDVKSVHCENKIVDDAKAYLQLGHEI